MSLAIKYENVEDARMRLRNTIVRYKDDPVIITDVQRGDGVDGILRVRFKELGTGKVPKKGVFNRNPFRNDDPIVDEIAADEQRKFISSKHFDIAPFKMGYVNSPRGAFYTSRMPNRIQKQGLCSENYRGVTNTGNPVNFQTFVETKETLEMIANRYPTFEQAKRQLDKVSSIAFSRDFCLFKDDVLPELLYLYHKGEKVGYVNGNGVTLGKKFICLKESLAELGVR